MISAQLTPLLAQPACAADGGSWCARIYGITGNDFLARYADPVIGTGTRVILIVAVAMLIRAVAHRTINRLTRLSAEGSAGGLLRPLRDRIPQTGRNAQTVVKRRAQRARTIGSVLKSCSTLAIYGIAFTLVLGELGINVGPIIASAGIIGLAIGFGAQNLVRDFLSGMFMLVEDQYGVGDVIDVGEATGIVEAVGLRITTLRDERGTVWYVRNGEVLRIGNFCQGFAMAIVDLPVAREANIKQATDVAFATAAALTADGTPLAPYVMEPPRMLGVDDISVEAITLRLIVKVRPGTHKDVPTDTPAEIVARALRAGIAEAYAEAGVPAPALV